MNNCPQQLQEHVSDAFKNCVENEFFNFSHDTYLTEILKYMFSLKSKQGLLLSKAFNFTPDYLGILREHLHKSTHAW